MPRQPGRSPYNRKRWLQPKFSTLHDQGDTAQISTMRFLVQGLAGDHLPTHAEAMDGVGHMVSVAQGIDHFLRAAVRDLLVGSLVSPCISEPEDDHDDGGIIQEPLYLRPMQFGAEISKIARREIRPAAGKIDGDQLAETLCVIERLIKPIFALLR